MVLEGLVGGATLVSALGARIPIRSSKCQWLGTDGGNVISVTLAQNAQILDDLLGRCGLGLADIAHEDELVLQTLPRPRGITIPYCYTRPD